MCTKLHILNRKKLLSVGKFYTHTVGSMGDYYQLCQDQDQDQEKDQYHDRDQGLNVG